MKPSMNAQVLLPSAADKDGLVRMQWVPSDVERMALFDGGHICLCAYTFNQPFQPIYLEVIDRLMRHEKVNS